MACLINLLNNGVDGVDGFYGFNGVFDNLPRKSAAGCEWDFIHDFSNTMLYIMMLVETQVLPEIENVASFLLHE